MSETNHHQTAGYDKEVIIMKCDGKNKECNFFNSGMYTLKDDCTNCEGGKCINEYHLFESVIGDLKAIEYDNVDVHGFGIYTGVEKHKIEDIINKYL